jgi:hypothetical protein
MMSLFIEILTFYPGAEDCQNYGIIRVPFMIFFQLTQISHNIRSFVIVLNNEVSNGLKIFNQTYFKWRR